MPVTFAEDATGEEAKAADEARVTPDEKDGSARCETVKKVATELAGPSEKYQATAATELCGLPDQCCAPEKCCGGRTPILSAEKRERRHRVARWCLGVDAVVPHRVSLDEQRRVHGQRARAGQSDRGHHGAAASHELRLRPLYPL